MTGHPHRNCDCLLRGRGAKSAGSGTVRLPTENRNQTSIHKAAHGLTEPLRPPAPPSTRHVRLRSHPGPGYGHAVDRHSTTAAASTAPVARARPSTSCSAAPKPSTDYLRSSSEACVPILLSCRHDLVLTLLPQINFLSLTFCFSTLAKAPAVRRACTSCHSGKTRCSEILPCQV
jgi:hypothetical protein